MMSISKVSQHLGESFTAWGTSGLATLAAVAVKLEWIDVGTKVMGLISITALAVLNVLILGNWMYRKFFRKNQHG